jgi:molecular chaperone GrpE (heat shock protein)
MTFEERRLTESSSSDTTTETTTPSQKARNLRQQLDQALHTSTMIRDTQERLGAELSTFKSRLEQQRKNGSPQRGRHLNAQSSQRLP